MRSIPHWLVIASILMLALVLRLVGAVWWQGKLPDDQKFYFGDSASYWDLASDIATGQEYEYQGAEIFRTPGYPVTLAPLFVIWKSEPPVIAARIWNACLGTITVGLVMMLGAIQFNHRIACLSGLFAAVLPEAIAGSVFVLSEAAFVPLMLGQLVLAMQARQLECNRRGSVRAFAAGALGGVATLVRPSWLLFTIFHTLMLACFRLESTTDETTASCEPRFTRRSTIPRRIILMTLPMAGLLLTMAPWWLRNYSISGSFVSTTTEVGASLYDGLNPAADGSSNMVYKARLVQEFAAFDKVSPPDHYPAAREVRLDHFFRQRALTWAQEHPGDVLRLAGTKFVRMWNIWPNASEFRSTVGRLLIALTYGPILVLAVIGIVKYLPTLMASRWLLVLPAVYLTLLHMVFVSSLRYRLPALLPLLVLSAAGASWAYDRYVVSRTSP